jgi:hypothetical protein
MGSKRLAALAACGLLLVTACTPSQLETVPGPEEGPGGISAEAWNHALAAHQHAVELGLTTKSLITIIDYSKPSSERRLWVVDRATHEVLLHEYVAHAVGTGGVFASRFSNREGSNQSSLGTFITVNPFFGIRGLALRLRGVEPGINDHAWSRGIVFHGTPGVSETRAQQGNMGRTQGCPAVPMSSIRRLVKLIEGGVLVFAWYPDPHFLGRSEFVDRSLAWRAGG